MRRGLCFLVPQHQTKIINTVSQMTRTQIVSVSATYMYSRDYSGVCDKCAYDQVLPVATLLATFANVPPGRAKEKFQSLLASSESAEGLRVKAANFYKNGWCDIRVRVPLCFIQCREMNLLSVTPISLTGI